MLFLAVFSADAVLESPVTWLKWLDHKCLREEETPISVDAAKKLLCELVERELTIDITADDVFFEERGSRVLFDQLSDGYRSVLVWTCDLLVRLSKSQPEVWHTQDYQGIVLVDEIGTLLHPKWQFTIVRKLRRIFPKIQFIFTTHCPTIVLGASEDAVFYKLYKEEGETKVLGPFENKSMSHLMANGILTAPFLFNLPSAKSAAHQKGESFDTSDDYLSTEIHLAIEAKIHERDDVTDKELFAMIAEELGEVEKEGLGRDDQG